jgi:hypothetical protein
MPWKLVCRGHFWGMDESKMPGIIGGSFEGLMPKPSVHGSFPLLHRRIRLLPKMVPRKVKKIQHIVVRA